MVDTGGIEITSRGTQPKRPCPGSIKFVPQIKARALIAVQDADIIVLVVDGARRYPPPPTKIAESAAHQKPVPIAANKADHVGHFKMAVEFYGLGWATST
ncbi:MAG: hypothetical protein IPK19_21900 [Chloroflexi bacterium]|nr:hypothetical protein [Chloroflexota bacterium]